MVRRLSRIEMLLALLLLLALALRILHLGRFSLWLDEGATWWNATRAGWLATAFAEPNHPPVWWLVTRASILTFGDSEFALRLPSALCGTLAVGLTFLLGRRLFPGEPGRGPVLLLTALAATNTFLIDHAQEARMYSGLLAESAGLSLLLFLWLDHRRARVLVAYFGLGALAILTHYFAVWPLLGHAGFMLVRALQRRTARAWREALALWAAQSGVLAVLIGWLSQTLQVPHGVAVGGRFDALERLLYSLWRIGVGPALAAIDRPRVDAGLVAFGRAELPAIAVTALLWIVPLLVGTILLRRRGETAAFLASAILVPIAGMLAIQSRLPLMHEKYLIYLAPPMLAVAAFGACSAPQRLRSLLVGGLLALNVAGVLAYQFPEAPPVATALVHGHPHGHEQWRELWAAQAAHGDSAATVVLAHGYLDHVWLYYDRSGRPLVRLPEAEIARPARDRAILAALGTRAWFIFAHDRDVDRSADLATIARGAGVPPRTVEDRVVLLPRSWGIRVLEWPPSAGAEPLLPENATRSGS